MLARVLAGFAILSLLIGLPAGCGKSGPQVKTVAVSGTVYLDDKPVDGVTVVFVSDSPAFTGVGKTGPDGKYRLDQGSITGKTGATPGKNKVYFSKIAGADAGPMQGGTTPSPSVDGRLQGEQLPAKYSNPLSPQFSFDVPEKGASDANFKLTTR